MADAVLTANVLLVDKDIANLMALEALLAPLGTKLVRARSGEEALRRLRDEDFAAVLMDIELPGIDAFETAKRARAQERSRHIPFIFLAPGESMEFPVAGAYRLGAVDYLVRPLAPDIIRAKVAVFVELFRRAEQVRLLEHRLREQSERRYRAIIENSWDAVTLLAADGTIRYASPATLRVLGYAPDELVGRNAIELTHPDDQPARHGQFARLLAGPGTSDTDSFRYRHRDDSWRWVEATCTNLLHEPSVRGVVENFRDVTEQRRAAEALRESEQHYRALADSMPVMVYTCRPDGQCDYCNRRWYDYTGQPAGRAEGTGWAEASHPADREATRAAWEEAVCAGRPYEREQRLRAADGSYRWFLCRAEPLRDGRGQVVKWFGNCTDIQQMKKAREIQTESERRLMLALETAKLGAWQLDLASGAVVCSERFRTYFGLPRGSAVTYPQLLGLIHPDDREPARAAAERAVAQRTDYEAEYRAVRPDGSTRWIYARGRPVYGPGNVPLRLVGMTQDVTERKHLEEELRQRAERLAEADRRKDEFLAMLSHELRNPLAPIANAVQVLKQAGHDDPQCTWARGVIARQAQHLTRLIDDLLDVSRVTRGKVQLRTEPVELRAVLDRAVETSRPLIDARRHELTVSLPPAPMRVEADPTRLAQVVSNLLNNAAKYTPEGGRIWLSAEPGSAPAGPAGGNGGVVVRVRDTGAGIAPDFLPHVFDLFTQGEHSLARSEGGLGIGLALVRRLVELHGGTVEAASDGPGRGSEFVLRLPALREPAGGGGAPRTVLAADGPARAGPCRILVVEDNPDSADSIAMLLRMWGHDVRVVYDGISAVDVARAYRPRLVLLDIGLPGITGLEVARQLRQEPGLSEAVLVAMTGYGQEEDRRRSREAGMTAHLVKPVDPESLRDVIGRLAAVPARV
jgi:PAS domain S-box-containing protein